MLRCSPRMRWRAPKGISWEPSMSRQVTSTGRAWRAFMVTSDTRKNTRKRNMQINFSGDKIHIYGFMYQFNFEYLERGRKN